MLVMIGFRIYAAVAAAAAASFHTVSICIRTKGFLPFIQACTKKSMSHRLGLFFFFKYLYNKTDRAGFTHQ